MLLVKSRKAFPTWVKHNSVIKGKGVLKMNVFDKVKEYILQQLPVDEAKITADAKLIDDLGADSANLMMLIMDLEGEFNTTVEDEVLGSIKTVGDIVSYIEKHI